MATSRPSRTLSTGERVLDALRVVMERESGVTPKELAYALRVSLSTAYHLVHTLVATGYVTYEPYRGLRPGPALYELLDLAAARRARGESFEPLADEVARVTGCRVYLATWVDRDVEVTYVRGRRGVRELPGLGRGVRGAANALALGKVLLAGRDPADWPDYLHAERLPSQTPFTLGERSALALELQRVQAHKVAFDREEYALGSCCVAVPLGAVFPDGPTEVALGISAPARRFQAESTTLTAILRQAAGA